MFEGHLYRWVKKTDCGNYVIHNYTRNSEDDMNLPLPPYIQHGAPPSISTQRCTS